MNVNHIHHPRRIDVCDFEDTGSLRLEERNGDTSYVYISTVAEADRILHAAQQLRLTMGQIVARRAGTGEALVDELCPPSFDQSRRRRLVEVAEIAALADDDVEGAIREAICTLSAPSARVPVCAGQAPGAAR